MRFLFLKCKYSKFLRKREIFKQKNASLVFILMFYVKK